MAQIDFVTALGRLLRNGPLRDAYATDPTRTLDSLDLRGQGRQALLGVDAEDLEFQAEVLLHKRFEAVSRLIPQTIANADARAWQWFAGYARDVWPTGDPPELDDATRFCQELNRRSESLVAARERNRLHFAMGNACLALHVVSDALVRCHHRRCVQILVRLKGRAWRELLIYIG